MLFKKNRLIILFLVGLVALSSEKVLMMNKPVVEERWVQGIVTAPFIRNYHLTRGALPQINKDLMRFAQFNRYPDASCYQCDQNIYGEKFENNESIIAAAGDFLNVTSAVSPRERTFAFVSADLAACTSEDSTSAMNLPMGARLYVTEYDNYFEFSHMRWWSFKIAKEDVFTADYLDALTQNELRDLIIQQARKLLGRPYQWGGRTAFSDSGFDCAGLVNIVYQSCGRSINRMVGYQRRDSKKIERTDMQPADLIFLCQNSARSNPAYVFLDTKHVLLYLGDDLIIHATPDTGVVEETTFEAKYGIKLEDYQEGQVFDGYYLAFGSFL